MDEIGDYPLPAGSTNVDLGLGAALARPEGGRAAA
jgi:hypothetical protein